MDGGEPVRAYDAVQLGLGAALSLWVKDHGLNKTHEGIGCGVAAGFEEAAGDVCSLVVGEVVSFLLLDEVNTEAGLTRMSCVSIVPKPSKDGMRRFD